jgi:pimeloyl-ACP methyl ester carboxylesterase
MTYETLELNDESRKQLSGEFIDLSNGYVHYEIKGSEQAEAIVLVHGFSSPMFVWDNTFNFLVEEGFRVLRYDLYGRGYSDRPKIKYDYNLFIQQLYELLDKFSISNFNLIGLSMGGGISVAFTERYPDLIKRLVLVAPIGLPTEKPIYPYILKIPILSRIFAQMIGHKRILDTQRRDFVFYDDIEDYMVKFAKQLDYKGYLQALRSTLVNMSFTGLSKSFERVGKLNIPIQLFWGENDPVIPYSTSEKACILIPSTKFHTIKNCGHIPQYTHPNEVNPLMLEFLHNSG